MRGSAERIELALERHELAELRRAAHQLKGASATIGARALGEACGALARPADTDWPALVDQTRTLRTLGQNTVAELRQRLL